MNIKELEIKMKVEKIKKLNEYFEIVKENNFELTAKQIAKEDYMYLAMNQMLQSDWAHNMLYRDKELLTKEELKLVKTYCKNICALKKETINETKRYVNIDNPNDVIEITKKKKVYGF